MIIKSEISRLFIRYCRRTSSRVWGWWRIHSSWALGWRLGSLWMWWWGLSSRRYRRVQISRSNSNQPSRLMNYHQEVQKSRKPRTKPFPSSLQPHVTVKSRPCPTTYYKRWLIAFMYRLKSDHPHWSLKGPCMCQHQSQLSQMAGRLETDTKSRSRKRQTLWTGSTTISRSDTPWVTAQRMASFKKRAFLPHHRA